MIKVFENKTYVLDNARIAEPNEQVGLNEQKAFESTMTYRVLKAHNRSGDMENLDIRFDSMGLR